MRKIFGLAAVSLLLATVPLHAQSTPPLATVVTTCGTPPSTYTAGQNRPITQDVNGVQCSGSGSAGSTVTANQGTANAGTANSWWVQIYNSLVGVKGTDGATIAGPTNPLPDVIVPATSGGVSTFSVNVTTAGAGAGTGGVAVDASPGQLYGYALWNGNSSVCYASFFDASQATTNLGTTAPKLAIGIPALGGANIAFPIGIPFATAITISATTTRNGSTACSTGIDYNVLFK